MDIEEVNKYSNFFAILDILKLEYLDKRDEESKQEDISDYWKVDTKKDMHCFSWNSNGIGKTRGFELKEVLLVAHGGNHNDTICTVEKKFSALF